MPWFVVVSTINENAMTWQTVASPDGSEASARRAARELEDFDSVDGQSITVIQAENTAEAVRLAGMPTSMAPPSFSDPSQSNSSGQTSSS